MLLHEFKFFVQCLIVSYAYFKCSIFDIHKTLKGLATFNDFKTNKFKEIKHPEGFSFNLNLKIENKIK